MGGASFEQYVPHKGTADEAYEQACAEATHERGHDGYNGTISTTNGCIVITQTPLPTHAAYKLARERLDDFSKWGACGAIPMVDTDKASMNQRTIEVAVTVTSLDPNQPTWELNENVVEMAKKKVRLHKNEQIINVEIGNGWGDTKEPERTFSNAVAATKGPTETRYFVIDRSKAHHSSVATPRWQDGHPSQAAARKVLDAKVKEHRPSRMPGDPLEEYDVIGVTRRADGRGLVEGERRLIKVVYHCTATVGEIDTSGGHTGWLFFGIVAM